MNGLDNKIKRIFEVTSDEKNIPGFSVGIIRNDESYFYSYGNSRLSDEVEINKHTKFHIASISKYFTFLLFEKLEKQGLVNIKDFLSKYIGNTDINSDIRLEHLISHRSGIRDQWDLTQLAGWRPHDVISNADIIHLYLLQQQKNYPSGSHYSYSNTNYTLLAFILEQITHKSIITLMREFVLEEYGLNDTNFYSYIDDIPNFASAYREKNYQFEKDMPNFQVTGSTSMYSTVQDLVSFEKINHQVLQKSVTKNYSNNFAEIFYDKGLITFCSNELLLQLHSGLDYSYTSMLLRIPDSQFSLIILTNSGISKLFDKALLISEIFVPELSNELLLEASLGRKKRSTNTIDLVNGYYLNKESNNVTNVTNKNGIEIDGEAVNFYLDLHGILEKSLTQIKLISATCFEMIINGDIMLFEKIEGHSYEFQKEFFGRYYSRELKTYYDIEKVDKKIFLKSSRFQQYSLIEINDAFCKSERFTLKFEKHLNGDCSFSISTMRSWNILFEKCNN